MPEVRSALASQHQAGTPGARLENPAVSISESPIGDLVMVSAWRDSFETVCRLLSQELESPMPDSYRRSVSAPGCCIFLVAPRRLLFRTDNAGMGPRLSGLIDSDQAAVTELGHSRTRLYLEGPETRAVLSRGLAIDLDPSVFPTGSFAQCAIHHIPLLIHNASADGSDDRFEILVLRTFALSFWHWITSVADTVSGQILNADRRP